MTRYLKSTMMVLAGLCWLLFAVFLGLFLLQYLSGGAGLQVFGFFFPLSSTTVLVGLVHVIGLFVAAFLCFAIGVGLCVRGLFPAPAQEKTASQPRAALMHGIREFRNAVDGVIGELRGGDDDDGPRPA